MEKDAPPPRPDPLRPAIIAGAFEKVRRMGRGNRDEALYLRLAGYLADSVAKGWRLKPNYEMGMRVVASYDKELAEHMCVPAQVPPGMHVFAPADVPGRDYVYATPYPPWTATEDPFVVFGDVLARADPAMPCWSCRRLCFLSEVPETWPRRVNDDTTITLLHSFKCAQCVETYGFDIPVVDERNRIVRRPTPDAAAQAAAAEADAYRARAAATKQRRREKKEKRREAVDDRADE